MAKTVDEKISDIDNNQSKFYMGEKNSIMQELKTMDLELDEKYNEILASILGKDASEITSKDFVGDKLEYLKYMATDQETLDKIASTKESIEKDKMDISQKVIKLLKFKAILFKSNEKIIAELEEEMMSRRKECTKVNEKIVEDEPEAERLQQEIERAQKNLDEMKAQQEAKEDELLNNIAAMESKLALTVPTDPTYESDTKQLTNFRAQLESSKADYDGNYDRIANQSVININTKSLDEVNKRLAYNKYFLGLLKINQNQSTFDKLKQDNLDLYSSFEQDVLDYQKAGIDINPEDLKQDIKTTPVSTPENVKAPENTNTNANTTKTIQPKASNTQPANETGSVNQNSTNNVVETAEPQVTGSQNLPTPLSPIQIANNLKNRILTGSIDEGKSIIAAEHFDDLAQAIPSFSRKDRKALAEKVEQLNTEVNPKRLQNVITALNRSGVCSNFNVGNIINSNGKLKDLKDISEQDISSLNTFISEIGANKDYIDEEQLEFLQNGLINNIKSKSLAHSLRPKTLGDFFRGREAKERDENLSYNTSTLLSNLSEVHKADNKQSKVKNVSKFYENLFDQTNEIIETPPQIKNKEDKTISR